MISKTSNRLLSDELGAVEFVESSLVFTSILIFIGLLVILTFSSLKAIYTQESTYFSLLNSLVEDDAKETRRDESIKRSNGIIYSVRRKDLSDNKTLELSRINFYSFSRKVDFINDFVEEFGIDDKLSEIYKSKSEALQSRLEK